MKQVTSSLVCLAFVLLLASYEKAQVAGQAAGTPTGADYNLFELLLQSDQALQQQQQNQLPQQPVQPPIQPQTPFLPSVPNLNTAPQWLPSFPPVQSSQPASNFYAYQQPMWLFYYLMLDNY